MAVNVFGHGAAQATSSVIGVFEDRINKLNSTGLFEAIDKDKDCDFQTDDEEGLLDITVKLKTRTR